jgi:hypothetical protein
MTLRLSHVALFATALTASTQQHLASNRNKIAVTTAPPPSARPQAFHDSKYGVRFTLPSGWTLDRRDGELSTFHLDARTAPAAAEMRAVASLGFNPLPQSVLAGATFYYSVERHTTPAECATQPPPETDIQDIAGMEFRHGHDEHGQICTEARDEVYTAFRKGSCYRFDLTVNTFCRISSGADDLTEADLISVEQQMTNILSTVTLDWNRSAAPHPIPVPPVASHKKKKADPELIPRVTPLQSRQ